MVNVIQQQTKCEVRGKTPIPSITYTDAQWLDSDLAMDLKFLKVCFTVERVKTNKQTKVSFSFAEFNHSSIISNFQTAQG